MLWKLEGFPRYGNKSSNLFQAAALGCLSLADAVVLLKQVKSFQNSATD